MAIKTVALTRGPDNRTILLQVLISWGIHRSEHHVREMTRPQLIDLISQAMKMLAEDEADVII